MHVPAACIGRRPAEQMRKMFGADAAIRAAMRADTLMDQGDIEGQGLWQRITAAINELDRKTPRDGEVRH